MSKLARGARHPVRATRWLLYGGVDLWPPINYAPRRRTRFWVVEAPLFRATGALFPQEQVGTTFRTFFDEHQYVRGWCDRHPGTDRSYVDIGAGDGIDMNNTFELARAGWAGVCLEGYPLRFAQLAQTYRSLPSVTLVRAYVSPKNVGSLLQDAGVDRSVPVLNLDIDSYDLHIARALMEVT